MNFDFYDPSATPSPSEKRRVYFDTLAKTAELADTLITKVTPTAESIFYRISDPVSISKMELPIELPKDMLESLRIEFDEISDEFGTTAYPTVVLEFADDSECRISIPNTDQEILPYDVLPAPNSSIWHTSTDPMTNMPRILQGTIDRGQVAAIISRAALPSHDPALTDYRRLDVASLRQEIKDIIEATPYVTIDKVYVFDYEGHEIIVTSHNGHISEVAVEQPSLLPNDNFAMTLRTTLDHNAYSQEIYISEDGTKRPHAPLFEDIVAFRDILDDLLDHAQELSVTSESFERHVEQIQAAEYVDRPAPDER